MTNEPRAAPATPVAVPDSRAVTPDLLACAVTAGCWWCAHGSRHVHRQQIIRGRRRGTLMRHVLLLGPIATGARRMGQATAMTRLVAPTGGAPALAPGLLCTAAGTVDLAAVAAAADEHLSPAADTQEQPPGRLLWFRRARTWTASATSGILPRHACSARCGARRRSQTCQFRSVPCLPIRQVVTAPSCTSTAPRTAPCGYVDNARALPTDPQVQQTAASVILIVLEQQASTACLSHLDGCRFDSPPRRHRDPAPSMRGFRQPSTSRSRTSSFQ
jgi:hypothetical protein